MEITLDALRDKLEKALQPQQLEIIDMSASHQGHQGHRPGFVTHVRITIESEKFIGLNRVAQYRLVHEILAEELASSLHALQLRCCAPETGLR